MRKVLFLLLATLTFTTLLAVPAAAQNGGGNDSVLVRVNGNVSVPDGESHGVVVVVNGDLRFRGDANTVVVVEGNADLVGASIETLVVVSGTANLGADTVVSGDVYAVDTSVSRDPSATVQGTIQESVGWEVASGFWILGVLFLIGWAVLVMLGGLVLAAVAPELSRRAGRVITTRLGATIVASLILWIVLPVAGGLLAVTVVGIPVAITIWLVILPALGFVGFLVSGIRIGEFFVAREGGVGHPYMAAFLGLLALVVVGVIPGLGGIVVALAGFLGSGALALMALDSTRGRPAARPEVAEPTSLP